MRKYLLLLVTLLFVTSWFSAESHAGSFTPVQNHPNSLKLRYLARIDALIREYAGLELLYEKLHQGLIQQKRMTPVAETADIEREIERTKLRLQETKKERESLEHMRWRIEVIFSPPGSVEL